MLKQVDILLDDNFDVQAENGDFKHGDCTLQNQHLILVAHKGEWKQEPLTGIGIAGYLLDDANIDEMHQEAAKQFGLDGMTVKKITGRSWINTKIEAYYE